MKQTLYTTLVWIVLLTLTTGCVSSKKMTYFQDTDQVPLNLPIQPKAAIIQPGDFLKINVTAIDAQAVAPFNVPVLQTAQAGQPIPQLYLVSTEGSIQFPVLGTLAVKGMTTEALIQHMQERISVYVKNPIVNIVIDNFEITVLGEVKRPGMYTIPNQQVSIPEALGLAGDLTIQGNRKNVVLIREEEGVRKFIPIDLTSKELFSSPYYYLAQNDVLYVDPNKAKMNSSAVGANAGIIISSISAVISLIAILTR